MHFQQHGKFVLLKDPLIECTPADPVTCFSDLHLFRPIQLLESKFQRSLLFRTWKTFKKLALVPPKLY